MVIMSLGTSTLHVGGHTYMEAGDACRPSGGDACRPPRVMLVDLSG